MLTLLLSFPLLAATHRACAVGDPVPAGMVGASTGTVTATGGVSFVMGWTGSQGAPFHVYTVGTTYFVTTESGGINPRCVAIPDPLGEVRHLELRSSSAADSIEAALTGIAAGISPVRASGVHVVLRSRRGDDTLSVPPALGANPLFVYASGGADADTLDISGTLVCAVGGDMVDSVWAGTDLDTYGAICEGKAAASAFPDAGDTLSADGLLQNIVWGGEGDDVIDVGDAYSLIIGDLGLLVPSGDGADTITAGAGGNDISADGDHDLVYAGAGDDEIWGGEGDDEVHAGAGEDFVYGGYGFDEIFGGDGEDHLYGGFGLPEAASADGRDKISGGPGNDHLYGEDDEDVLCDRDADYYDGGYGDGNHLLHDPGALDAAGIPLDVTRTPIYSNAGPGPSNWCSDFSHLQVSTGTVTRFGESLATAGYNSWWGGCPIAASTAIHDAECPAVGTEIFPAIPF